MTHKTSLKYSGVKLKALFAGVVVACCCCIGLFANTNAQAENSITSGEVNSTGFTDIFSVVPTSFSGILSGCGSTDFSALKCKNITFAWSGSNGEVYGRFGACGMADWSYNLILTDSVAYSPNRIKCTASTVSGVFIGSDGSTATTIPEILNSTNWLKYNSFSSGDTFYICGGRCSGIPFTAEVYLNSKLEVSGLDTNKGTQSGTLSDSGFVFGDGTASNANMKLESSGSSFVLTVNDPEHNYMKTKESGSSSSTSENLVFTPVSGYKVKDVKIVKRSDASDLATLTSGSTYNVSCPSYIVPEFEQSITVTLDANDGSFPSSGSKTVEPTKGSAMPTLTSDQFPTRTGYTFNGFYDAKTGGNQYYDSTGKSAKNWDKDSNTTLYAQWTANTYTVKFDGNKPSTASSSVSGSMTDESMTYDTEKALTSNAYSLTGWTFAGWNTKKDGSGDSYTDGQAVKNLTATASGSVTLYAKWTANTYTIKFNSNKPETATNAVTGTMDNQPMVFDAEDTLAANKYELKGWDFICWNTKADGSGDGYDDEEAVKNLSTGSDVTLYAQWKAVTNEVILKFYDGSTQKQIVVYPTFDEDMPTLAKSDIPTREGYTFEGFYDGEQSGEETLLTSVAYADDASSTPVKYYNADGTSAHLWDKTTDTNLYAHWTANPATNSAATSGSGSTGDWNNNIFAFLAVIALLCGSACSLAAYRKRQVYINRKH